VIIGEACPIRSLTTFSKRVRATELEPEPELVLAVESAGTST